MICPSGQFPFAVRLSENKCGLFKMIQILPEIKGIMDSALVKFEELVAADRWAKELEELKKVKFSRFSNFLGDL